LSEASFATTHFMASYEEHNLLQYRLRTELFTEVETRGLLRY